MAATQKKTSTDGSHEHREEARGREEAGDQGDDGQEARGQAGGQAHRKKPAAKPTTAKKPAAKKSPFTPAFIAKQKALLEEERERFLRQSEDKQMEADQLVADRDPGDVQFDEESGEGDSIAVERSLDLALSAQARDAVQQIDDALARIENGTYGISIISGEPIPKARLEFIPWAAERVEEKVAKLGS